MSKTFCKCGHQRAAHSVHCTFCSCEKFQYRDREQKTREFAQLYGGGKQPIQPVPQPPIPLTWMEAAILTMYQKTIKPYIQDLEDRHNAQEAHRKLIPFPSRREG